MSLADYYRLLGIHPGCTLDEIKKAYREKAREFHPDINQSPGAKDMFINVTVAYEFLMTNYQKMKDNEEAYNRAMEEWRRYRQYRSRQKARAFAQTTFVRFQDTNFYKTTRIFDITTIASSMVISIVVLLVAILGYFYRINHPIPGVEEPSAFILALFILMGMTLFIMSFIHIRIFIQNSRKHKKKHYD